MTQLSPSQITSEMIALFDASMPGGPRWRAVVHGTSTGRAWTDDPAAPTWAVVQEPGFGTLYLGGSIATPLLAEIVSQIRQTGDVLIGLWPDDPQLEILPPAPDYAGYTLEFTDRPLGHGLEPFLRAVPANCHVQRIDAALFERRHDRNLALTVFGSVETALERGIGFCLMRDDQILSEAFAGPATSGIIEIGVFTHADHRQRGYATVTCAHLVRACEALGYRTYWNCAKQNLASAALARKLGYRAEKEYRLLAWFKSVGKE